MKKSRTKTARSAKTTELTPAFGAHELASIVILDTTIKGASLQQRAAFAKALRDYIRSNGYMPDVNGNYQDLIENVAKILHPTQIRKAERALDRIDELLKKSADFPKLNAHDASADRWIPHIDGAMLVGIAMGVSLVYNGGVRR